MSMGRKSSMLLAVLALAAVGCGRKEGSPPGDVQKKTEEALQKASEASAAAAEAAKMAVDKGVQAAGE